VVIAKRSMSGTSAGVPAIGSMAGTAVVAGAAVIREDYRGSKLCRGCGGMLSRGVALRHHGCVLARIRLTRTAAERGPVLSGECGQDALVEINRLRLVERANAHTPPGAGAHGGVECGHWPKPAWSAE
jgi:hypothetical protein